MIAKIKEFPDVWLYCLTVLLLPLSIGTAFKFYTSANFSYKNGETEIIFVEEAQKEVEEHRRLTKEQNQRIQRLTNAVENAQRASKSRNINFPELYYVEQAANEAEEANKNLVESNEQLQEIIDDNIVYE